MNNGTLTDEPGLNGELTEEQLFAEIQTAIKSGDESNLNKVMEQEDSDDSVVPSETPVLEASPAEVSVTTPVVETPAQPVEDWFAALPEETQAKVRALKDERDRFEHKIRSDEGRVPNLQRQVEELKRKVQAPRAPEPAPKPNASSNSTLDARIAAIREVDPMLADALVSIKDEVVAPIREEVITRTDRIANEVRQKEDQELWNRENEKLLAAVPQAHEVFKNPAYREWKQSQSEGVVTLAESMYADDVLLAFEKFARDMHRKNPQIVAPAQNTTAPASASPQAPSNVVIERARKLGASAPAAVSGVAKGGDGLPTDPQALFDHFTSKIRKGEM